MTSDLVIKWLKQVLTPYPHRHQAFAQIDSVLTNYPTLSPKTESFTFDDGRAALLVCLTGTIPVSYRANRYNIPIAIWIPHDFPIQPPIVFVTPTSEMVIRKGTHVEPGGQCQGGYLNTWSSKPEACSLVNLVEFFQDIFSREPPLYAKPKQVIPNSLPTTRPSPPPRPPPPPLPPSTQTSSSVQDYHPPIRPPLPPPLRPPPIYSSSSSPRSIPLAHSHRSSPIQEPHQNHHIPRSLTVYDPPQPSTTSSSHHQISHQLSSLTISPTPSNLLDEDLPIETPIIKTTSQVPPPRPPNPSYLSLRATVHSKLTSSLSSLSTSLSTERSQLTLLQSDLLKGEPAILDEINRLEAVKEVCIGVGYRYETLLEQIKERVMDLKCKAEVPVDELICSTTVLYNQLLELVAEDQAIDDTLYHLARALNHSEVAKIDLDKFLKRVRGLGREQFLKREIINKVSTELASRM
ncbi:hypothetical protein CROQUDRAFT_62074 [Cronartium quercuum f. sp. fusiforme G11]|uniref:UEV-domain-containing protein n=1 Tax=Cronartium quercuum f. sp. fusiforme G11 TaxID=708437 RepID=A0A9P6NJL2_9BASI|nr:hypothetical protein CROQUDRAFT_62074 [Cronartium quercuum f. sp. fusiforme G11]